METPNVSSISLRDISNSSNKLFVCFVKSHQFGAMKLVTFVVPQDNENDFQNSYILKSKLNKLRYAVYKEICETLDILNICPYFAGYILNVNKNLNEKMENISLKLPAGRIATYTAKVDVKVRVYDKYTKVKIGENVFRVLLKDGNIDSVFSEYEVLNMRDNRTDVQHKTLPCYPTDSKYLMTGGTAVGYYDNNIKNIAIASTSKGVIGKRIDIKNTIKDLDNQLDRLYTPPTKK